MEGYQNLSEEWRYYSGTSENFGIHPVSAPAGYDSHAITKTCPVSFGLDGFNSDHLYEVTATRTMMTLTKRTWFCGAVFPCPVEIGSDPFYGYTKNTSDYKFTKSTTVSISKKCTADGVAGPYTRKVTVTEASCNLTAPWPLTPESSDSWVYPDASWVTETDPTAWAMTTLLYITSDGVLSPSNDNEKDWYFALTTIDPRIGITDTLNGCTKWSSSTSYQVGDRVVYLPGTFTYKCKAAHTNKNPSSNPSYWDIFDRLDVLTGSCPWTTATIATLGSNKAYGIYYYTSGEPTNGSLVLSPGGYGQGGYSVYTYRFVPQIFNKQKKNDIYTFPNF